MVKGLEQFEWTVGEETVGKPLETLGPHCRKILRRAWTLTRWSAAARLAVVAELHRVRARERELIALTMERLFNPEAAQAFDRMFVTLADLEVTRFMIMFREIQAKLSGPAPVQAPPALPRPKVEPGHWPKSQTQNEAVRRAAVSYFGGRIKPFTIEELAEFFSVSVQTAHRWRRSLGLRCLTVGGTTRVSVEEVYRLVQSQTV